MSWQSYVDQSLVGTGKIDKAAIFSAEDGSVEAASPGFSVTSEEIQSLIKAFVDRSLVQAGGLEISGEKYFLMKADDRSIYGKKGKEGVCAVKTNKVTVVGHYPGTVQPGEAAKVVEALGIT